MHVRYDLAERNLRRCVSKGNFKGYQSNNTTINMKITGLPVHSKKVVS